MPVRNSGSRTSMKKIIYCLTDQAPLLSAYSIYPIIYAFAQICSIPIEVADVSIGNRILALFPEFLRPDQRVPDELLFLAKLATTRDANIIKPPSISASLVQLKEAIEELQRQGYALPDYPLGPVEQRQREIRTRYDSVRGSVVNTLLRQGNSERRVPAFVKAYVRHRAGPIARWPRESRSHVATMTEGDFRSTEQAVTLRTAGVLHVEHVAPSGHVTVLKDAIRVSSGDIIDGGLMRRDSLRQFLGREIEAARCSHVLFSLQLKCTTLRVSDPIIFGHAVRTYYAPLFAKYGAMLDELGTDPQMGFSAVQAAARLVPDVDEFHRLIDLAHRNGPALAMVDVARGISNLHSPVQSSIATSMAAAVRSAGRLLDADGNRCDTKFVIPDHAYAKLFSIVFDDCIARGALDPATVGSLAVVGLTADGAEEYGAQDKTFEIDTDGLVRIVDERRTVLIEHAVAAGDIWRMCVTTHVAVRDWIRRGIYCADWERIPTIFWLDAARPRDQEILRKWPKIPVSPDESTSRILLLSPADATLFTLDHLRKGADVIAVVGNVLRDYLTELFAVIEVGSSTTLQATTHLFGGGTLLEAGSGGCAPAHVTQFLESGHLRWNPLGEMIALMASLKFYARRYVDPGAQSLAQALERACQLVLAHDLLPSREVGKPDTRSCHFQLARLWAQEMAKHPTFGPRFANLAHRLFYEQAKIESELLAAQGNRIQLGGHYRPERDRVAAAMRPSRTLNTILEEM